MLNEDAFLSACYDVGINLMYSERQMCEYISKIGRVATSQHMQTMDRDGRALSTTFTFSSVIDGLNRYLLKDQITMYWATLNEIYI